MIASIGLWVLRHPRVAGMVVAVLTLVALLAWTYEQGQESVEDANARQGQKALERALDGVVEADKDLRSRPVDDALKSKGWLRED